MDFEKRLNNLSDYNVTFEIKQGYYHIALVFNKKWAVLDSDNPAIYIENRDGVIHYIAEKDGVTLDEMFDLIDETVNYNLDLQKKLDLFKLKAKELQEIFASQNLNVLETLTFTFAEGDDKKKKKNESTPKKKRQKKSAKKSSTNDKQEEVSESGDNGNNYEEEETTLINTTPTKETYIDTEESDNNEGYYEEEEETPCTDSYCEELERE